jgi:endonuclease-3
VGTSTRANGKARVALPRPAAETRRILARLQAAYPDAWTELAYRTPFELLVATVLSAQTTDARVNEVTPALFARYPDARALAQAEPAELESIIRPTGFFRAKARTLVALAHALVERFDGEVPRRLEDLVELPGVGRKTANIVLGHAFGIPGLGVDRHVLRVANRLGIARGDDPDLVERQLTAALPPSQWTRASDTLILHGRRVCKPRPRCEACVVRTHCAYYQHLGRRRPIRRPAARSRAR